MINTSFKKRLFTSITLLVLLFLMFIDNLVLGYLLILLGVFSFIEFTKMNKLVYPKKKILQLSINIFFLFYIFLFCSFFLVSSYYIHLKFILFSILITCIFSDIGGYVFGKILKGPKLTKISPRKTIAGALGSLVFSIIVIAIIFYFVTKKIDILVLLVGLTTSIGCQLGDLFISLIKRKASLKDTGNLLPGHGGILDRVDGILVGLPVGFATLILLIK